MEFSLNYLQEVLPPTDPPLELIPPQILDEYPETEDESDEIRLTRRSARWTYAIFSEIRGGYYSQVQGSKPFGGLDGRNSHFFQLVYPRWREMSVGVFDRQYEGSGFGLIATVPFAAELPFSEK